MGILFVAKSFGEYHYFSTEAKRTDYINTLPEWLQKFVETYEVRFGKVE